MKETVFIKKTIALAVLAAALVFNVSAQGGQDVDPAGVQGEISMELSDFDDLTVEGISSFSIVQGEEYSVVLKGDRSYVESVVVGETENCLLLRSTEKAPVDALITVPGLSSLIVTDHSAGTISGYASSEALSVNVLKGSTLTAAGTLDVPRVAIYTGKNGRFEGAVQTEILGVDTSADGEVALSGRADDFSAVLKAASVGDFRDLSVQTSRIISSGSSSVEAEFPGNSNTTLTASGSSSVSLTMNGPLRATLSGDSTLKYSGEIIWMEKKINQKDRDDHASFSPIR